NQALHLTGAACRLFETPSSPVRPRRLSLSTMKPWSGQVDPSRVFGLFLSRGLLLLVLRRQDPAPGSSPGFSAPRRSATRGPHSTIRGHARPGGPTHPHPPRRPFVRPPSGDTGVSRASRPRSELARSGTLVSDRLSHPTPHPVARRLPARRRRVGPPRPPGP